MDLRLVDEWVRQFVAPTGPVELFRDRPWASIAAAETTTGRVWFKECAPHIGFEPRLSTLLSRRSPDVVAGAIAFDEGRRWLLLADAGTPAGAETTDAAWEAVLPRYAELQIRELPFVDDHLAHGVPDRRAASLPALYDEFLRQPMPISEEEIGRLRRFAPDLVRLCAELDSAGIADSVQHDDLHGWNLFVAGSRLRVLDWGDACVSHPFCTPGVTFRFIRAAGPPGDARYRRFRSCYLEPWGSGLEEVFDLAIRFGALAHAVAWSHQRARLTAAERLEFDEDYVNVLRRAVRMTTPG